jgi:hypothetical protein
MEACRSPRSALVSVDSVCIWRALMIPWLTFHGQDNEMRSSSKALGLITVVMTLLSGCAKTVNTDAGDATPPTIDLEVFEIPTQPGASSQPNPESVDATCCDLRRLVNPGDIPLIAIGVDPQGVKSVEIWISGTTISCEHEDGTASIQQGLTGSPAAANSDPNPSPTTGLDRRTATYTLQIPGRQGACVKRSGSVDVFGKASNFTGQEAVTKTVTLQFPIP